MGSVGMDVRCPCCGQPANMESWYNNGSEVTDCRVCGYYRSHMIFYEACVSENDPELENGYLNHLEVGRGVIIAYDKEASLERRYPVYRRFTKTYDNDEEAEEWRKQQDAIVLETTVQNGIVDVLYAEEKDYIARHFANYDVVDTGEYGVSKMLLYRYPMNSVFQYKYKYEDEERRIKERISRPDIFARILFLPITPEKLTAYRMKHEGSWDVNFYLHMEHRQMAYDNEESRRKMVLISKAPVWLSDEARDKLYTVMKNRKDNKDSSSEFGDLLSHFY